MPLQACQASRHALHWSCQVLEQGLGPWPTILGHIDVQGMEKILEVSKYYDKLPQHIDKIYGKKNWNKYGIFPAICFQSEDPALFKKAVEKLPIKLRFKSLSRFTEYSSVIIPILIILIIVYFLIYNFY